MGYVGGHEGRAPRGKGGGGVLGAAEAGLDELREEREPGQRGGQSARAGDWQSLLKYTHTHIFTWTHTLILTHTHTHSLAHTFTHACCHHQGPVSEGAGAPSDRACTPPAPLLKGGDRPCDCESPQLRHSLLCASLDAEQPPAPRTAPGWVYAGHRNRQPVDREGVLRMEER